MSKSEFQNLEDNLSVLGKNAHLSLSQKQAIRDKLFKKIGQLDLVDSMQTKTESMDLVMPLKKLQDILRPRKVTLSLPATFGLLITVFVATVTTGAIAQTAEPGDPLFGVRKALETVQVALIADPASKAALQLSIADERLQGLENVDPAKLEAVLNESKRALASAQTSVDALKEADEAASADLLHQLQELITSQREIVGTIIGGGIVNEAIEETILAFRDELDAILPESVKPPIVEVLEQSIFHGALVTSYGFPAINTGAESYILVGTTPKVLEYVGSDHVRVVGELVENPIPDVKWGIAVSEITVDSKLIFESKALAQNIFYGKLVVANNQPALDTGIRTYLLIGNSQQILSYAGSNNVRVMGELVEEPTPSMKWGIAVSEITLGGQLIFENQDYIVNDLPRVEDSQK